MMTRLFLAFAFLSLPLQGGQQDNTKVEGATKDIQWGKHWAGPELKAPDELKGKVVLLVIWGG